MALDYFLLVFIGAVGVYQIASIPAGLKGLWFFGQPILQCLFGIAVVVSAFAWFFTDEKRPLRKPVVK